MLFLWIVTVMGGAYAVYTLLNRIRLMDHRFDRLMSRMDRLESGPFQDDKQQSPSERVAAMAARIPSVSAPVVENQELEIENPEPVIENPEPVIENPEPETRVITPAPVISPPAEPTNRWAARVVRDGPADKAFAAVRADPPVPPPPHRAPPPPPPTPTPLQPQVARKGVSIEALIGGKLPIWVGGVALILSAFFLVRYSIEQGLLGPGVRSVLAALFGVALLIASEVARRTPRFADDPRVGQALAGAGIASLYGTLYMAGQLYGLISPLVAFVLMAAVTAGALFLSLRHGPPTAIMGLIGGFTAPFLAAPSGNLVPLLIYLGLLIAGLFAVAIQRGWIWLALAATGGGAVWTFGIMAADLAGIGPSLGMFIVVLALAVTILFPRTGSHDPRIRLIPMIVGFVQLALFAPMIQFDASGWALYGLLSAASLYLGWRDPKLMPATLAALGLVLILLFAAFEQGRPLALWAAIAATALFAVPGHLLARKANVTDKSWTALALGGLAGPLLVAWISQGNSLLMDAGWGLLFSVAALVSFSLSWRAKDEGQQALFPDWALFGGGVLAGFLAFIAAYALVPSLWMAAAGFAVMFGVSAWALRVKDSSLFTMSLPFGMAASAFWLIAYAQRGDLAEAIFVDGGIPAVDTLLALFMVPAALFAASGWCHNGRLSRELLRWIALGLAAAVPLALVPAVWHAAAMAACAAALGLWARQASDAFRFRASLALVVPGGLFWVNQMILNPSVFLSIMSDGPVPSAYLMAALIVVPAALLALNSWCHRDQVSREMLRWLVLALIIALVLALVPYDWHGPSLAVMAGAAAFAAARVPLPRLGLEALFGAAAAWLLIRLAPFIGIVFQSAVGVPTHYDQLDPVVSIMITCGLPAFIFALTAWKTLDRLNASVGMAVIFLASAAGIATLYALIKQPLAIATDGQFLTWGFIERAVITQLLAAIGLALLWRGGERLRRASYAVLSLAAARLIGFDLLMFNPVLVDQNVGALPFFNAASIHYGLAALVAFWVSQNHAAAAVPKNVLRFSALGLVAVALAFTVRQAFQGAILTGTDIPNAENYGYSVAFLILSLIWLWRGIAGGARWLRMTGLGLLTLVTLKVFLIDAAALEGLLRVLSFMGLGGALIGIGWVYTRVLTREAEEEAQSGG